MVATYSLNKVSMNSVTYQNTPVIYFGLTEKA